MGWREKEKRNNNINNNNKKTRVYIIANLLTLMVARLKAIRANLDDWILLESLFAALILAQLLMLIPFSYSSLVNKMERRNVNERIEKKKRRGVEDIPLQKCCDLFSLMALNASWMKEKMKNKESEKRRKRKKGRMANDEKNEKKQYDVNDWMPPRDVGWRERKNTSFYQIDYDTPLFQFGLLSTEYWLIIY